MSIIISDLRKELRQNSNQKIKESSKRFFKEKVKTYGSKTAEVSKIGKKYFNEIKDKNKREIFDFLMSKKAVMPRTAFRYAIEKMPKDLKTIAMEK